MNISSPQEFFRKTSDSQQTLKPSPRGAIPDKSFQELLQTHPTDEKPREKDLFSLVEEEEEEKIIDGPSWAQIPLNAPLVFSSACAGLSNTAMSAQTTLSAEIEAIFEKMASSMIVMSSSGEVETTLFLDNPSSIFFGTKITVREFSTAPKAFNVEIASSPSAIHAIEASKNHLLSAFQHGKFNFSIHRLETSIQSEDRPVFHRKESSDRDHREGKGGREE